MGTHARIKDFKIKKIKNLKKKKKERKAHGLVRSNWKDGAVTG